MKMLKKITSLLLIAVFTVFAVPVEKASAYDNYIDEGVMYLIDVNHTDDYMTLTFLPKETGYYKFSSFSERDPYVYCFDDEGNMVSFDDDSGIDKNFSTTVFMDWKLSYTFFIYAYDETNDAIFAKVEKIDDRITELKENESCEVALSKSTNSVYRKFVPKSDGYYAFYSSSDEDTYAFLYDNKWNVIDEDNDSGVGKNFSLSCYLEKGKKYYLEATGYEDSKDLSFDICIKPTKVVSEIEILSLPTRMDYYEGEVKETIDYSGLRLKLKYTDSSVAYWSYDENEEIDGVTVDVGCAKDENSKYYVYVIAGFAYNEFYINEIKKPDPTGILGDVDFDGRVTIMDATFIQMHLAEIISFSDAQLSVADFDLDNEVTILDATDIQMTLAGLI
ncbi:MAG: dockerin type I repeat-containing protein [Ruminococcus sp.]|nr:dockerin type I repeat-containing protein [Ruminococcus sp.]